MKKIIFINEYPINNDLINKFISIFLLKKNLEINYIDVSKLFDFKNIQVHNSNYNQYIDKFIGYYSEISNYTIFNKYLNI